MSRVVALHQQVVQFDNAVYRSATHPANPLRGLKCALSFMGICSNDHTLPLRPYSREESARVEKYLQGVDLLGLPAQAAEGSNSRGKN